MLASISRLGGTAAAENLSRSWLQVHAFWSFHNLFASQATPDLPQVMNAMDTLDAVAGYLYSVCPRSIPSAAVLVPGALQHTGISIEVLQPVRRYS